MTYAPSYFFISSFTVSVTPSINTSKSFNLFIILIMSFIRSFEINKSKSFFALTAPFPLILLSDLSIALEVKLLTNTGKLSLRKEMFFSLNLVTKRQKIYQLNYFRYLSFTKFFKGICYFSCLFCC